jgi:ribosomal protein S18 acetylase RimI-like enzyme
MDIVALGPGDSDRVLAAAELFDDPPKREHAARFLTTAGHHLLIAYVDGVPAGFITGVEMTHPDKGTEMFVYELGVAENHRRQGIGTTLTEHLAELARERGCYGMWVITDDTNVAALTTYARAGAARENESQVVLSWDLRGETHTPTRHDDGE